MRTNELSSLTPQRKVSNSDYKCSELLEPINRFLHLPSPSMFTHRNTLPPLDPEVTELRLINRQVVVMDSLKVE